MSRLAPLLIFLLVSLATALLALSAAAQEESTIDLIAVDAVVDGNEATVLGELDGCLSASTGDEVMIDVIVDAVPDDRPMIGYQMTVEYDPAILEATAFDTAYLIASKDSYEPIEGLSDELPDSDGSLLVVVADIASDVETGASIESGSGVLVRVTFTALAAGTSQVAVGFDPPDAYPAIIDDENTILQVDNLGSSTVAIDEECAADAAPDIVALPSIEDLQPTTGPTIDPSEIPTEAEGGGIDVGLLVGAIAISVAGLGAVGGGSLLFMRQRQRHS